MYSLLVSSVFLVVLAQCGYPVAENTYPTAPPTYPTPPSYPLPKKYPVAPSYPIKPTYPSPPTDYAQKPSYSAPPPPPAPIPSGYSSSSFSDSEVAAAPGVQSNYAAGTFRQRAKARTAQNRQFHQRHALQPIRRFQQKARQ
ncbi:unnamed protein product [Caenorhabditis sp. 36 PRJEB53466]|nr:unnamed protein product [Caenorhabditis sp. 36 PRJEB53466]